MALDLDHPVFDIDAAGIDVDRLLRLAQYLARFLWRKLFQRWAVGGSQLVEEMARDGIHVSVRIITLGEGVTERVEDVHRGSVGS
jgi:hypothetical protein